MPYTRFEDLPVWNTAIDLAVCIYELTSKSEFTSHYSLRDQIERAAVSVSKVWQIRRADYLLLREHHCMLDRVLQFTTPSLVFRAAAYAPPL